MKSSSARAKSLGKAKLDRGVISYIRQRGTSQSAASMWRNTPPVPPDQETAAFAGVVARAAAMADGFDADADADAFAAELRQIYTGIWRAELSNHHRTQRDLRVAGPAGSLKSALVSLVAGSAIALRRQWLRRLARQSILDDLGRHGASPAYGEMFRRELAQIEALLERPGFGEFVRRYAPELTGASASAALRVS